MDFAIARQRLLDTCLIPAGVSDKRLLRAFGMMPRHRFVAEAFAAQAYSDNSLPIGFGQTISKPSVVGRILQGANLRMQDRVLEIGTGSGYQTALLSMLSRRVYSTEVIDDFIARARKVLAKLDCSNVTLVSAGEQLGLEIEAPFDVIVLSACLDKIPATLFAQLNPQGGRLVGPVGDPKSRKQRIKLWIRHGDHQNEVDLGACVFVPMVTDKGRLGCGTGRL